MSHEATGAELRRMRCLCMIMFNSKLRYVKHGSERLRYLGEVVVPHFAGRVDEISGTPHLT